MLFAKPLLPDSGPGAALTTFVQENPKLELILSADGAFEGVRGDPKLYIAFLQSRGVSKENIKAFRDSLDDSRKAVLKRQREPRPPR